MGFKHDTGKFLLINAAHSIKYEHMLVFYMCWKLTVVFLLHARLEKNWVSAVRTGN